MKRRGYHPYDYYMQNPQLKAVVDQLAKGFDDHVSYASLVQLLLNGDGGPADQYFILADAASYREAHLRAVQAYQDPKHWNQMSLINIARSGIFAADRSVSEYAENIWNVKHK